MPCGTRHPLRRFLSKTPTSLRRFSRLAGARGDHDDGDLSACGDGDARVGSGESAGSVGGVDGLMIGAMFFDRLMNDDC